MPPFIGVGLGLSKHAASGSAPITWPPTLSTGTYLADWRADMGVTAPGGNISAVADQSGNSNGLSSGAGTVTLVSNVVGGTKPVMRFATGCRLHHGLSLSTNCSFAFVAKAVAGAWNGLSCWGNGGVSMLINESSAGGLALYPGDITNTQITSAFTAVVISVTNYNNVTWYIGSTTGTNITSGTSFGSGAVSELGNDGVGDTGNFDLPHFSPITGAVNSADAGKLVTALKNLWGV